MLMSTSRTTRGHMPDWVLTDDGDGWTVKLDVRDIGGHLDTTSRGWSATLAARVRQVICPVGSHCLCFLLISMGD